MYKEEYNSNGGKYSADDFSFVVFNAAKIYFPYTAVGKCCKHYHTRNSCNGQDDGK